MAAFLHKLINRIMKSQAMSSDQSVKDVNVCIAENQLDLTEMGIGDGTKKLKLNQREIEPKPTSQNSPWFSKILHWNRCGEFEGYSHIQRYHANCHRTGHDRNGRDQVKSSTG